MLRTHPRSPLFPYTTLFRSNIALVNEGKENHNLLVEGVSKSKFKLSVTPGQTNTGAVSLPAKTYTIYCDLARSAEHTSELQSPCNLVCRLLLEKKKRTSRPLPSALAHSASHAPHPPTVSTLSLHDALPI